MRFLALPLTKTLPPRYCASLAKKVQYEQYFKGSKIITNHKMGKEIICHCGAIIKEDDIEHWNTENEIGELYAVVKAICECGKSDETSQWGEWDSPEEAKECLKEYINPVQKDIEDEN